MHVLPMPVYSQYTNESHLPPLTSQENENTLLLMTGVMTLCIQAEISVWSRTVGVPFKNTH